MTISYSKKLAFGMIAGIALSASHSALAQSFPDRQVDVVLHAGAGGGTDITIRRMLPVAEEITGQRFPILPKSGGNGVVALKYMEGVEPDGYTVMTLTASHLAAIASGDTSANLDDITCLARLTDDPQYIMSAAEKYQTTEELIADITSRPIKIGGAQVGGTDHIAVASMALKMPEGFEYTYVPFDAAPATGAALVNGDIDIATINYSEARSMIEDGRIEPVLVLAEERQEVAPDVPTAREAGIDSVFSSLRALGTLSTVPDDRQQILSDVFVEAMESDTYQAYLADIGLTPATTAGAEGCNRQLQAMYTDTAAALEEIGFVE